MRLCGAGVHSTGGFINLTSQKPRLFICPPGAPSCGSPGYTAVVDLKDVPHVQVVVVLVQVVQHSFLQ